MRAWIITKDYIENDAIVTAVEFIGPHGVSDAMVADLKRGGGYAFFLKDDDGEIYYRGRATWSDDDVEEGAYGPLGDFGAPNAGCTSITYPKHPEYNCG